MASYELLIKPSAAKEIELLPRKDRQRVVAKIQSLVTDPRPSGCIKLSGSTNSDAQAVAEWMRAEGIGSDPRFSSP